MQGFKDLISSSVQQGLSGMTSGTVSGVPTTVSDEQEGVDDNTDQDEKELFLTGQPIRNFWLSWFHGTAATNNVPLKDMRFKNRTFQSYKSKATSVFNKLTEIANANDLPLPWEEHLDSAVDHKFQDLLNAWSDSVNQIRDGPNTNYISKLSAFKCSILTIWNFIHGMGSRVQSKEVGSKRKRSISTNEPTSTASTEALDAAEPLLALRNSTVTTSTALRRSTRNTVAFRRQLHVPSGPTIFDDVPPAEDVDGFLHQESRRA
jgi:hypothetical protein